MSFTYFSHNGLVLPAEQATVPLASIEYSYGFGVYETIRVSHGKPKFVDEHSARLMTSAEVLLGLVVARPMAALCRNFCLIIFCS